MTMLCRRADVIVLWADWTSSPQNLTGCFLLSFLLFTRIDQPNRSALGGSQMEKKDADRSKKDAFPRESSSSSPLVAGFLGGVVSTTLLFPLDIVKVRLQVNESQSKRKHRLRSLRIIGGILKYEGVRGLYSGWTPAVIGSAISWGGYFFFYESFKKRLVQHRQNLNGGRSELSSMDNFGLACLSGAIMVGLTNPVWLVKTRMQLQMKKASEKHNIKPYNGGIDAVRTIVREEGYLALYRGSFPAMLLTSHGGVQFVVYEYLKKHFHFRRAIRADTNSVWERLELSTGYLTIGAISKIVASTATYPLQVIKARMQQRGQSLELTADGDVRAVTREYAGMISSARKILNKEGIWGFFKGTIPNAIRVAPGAAITFVVYESVMDYLE